MNLTEQKAKLKERLCISGCEKCPHFVESDRAGKGWRQYCGLGNFNLNRASYEVQKTSHNKNKEVRQEKFDWEFDISNRCPLLRMKDENIHPWNPKIFPDLKRKK
jgi:hypothetical protein